MLSLSFLLLPFFSLTLSPFPFPFIFLSCSHPMSSLLANSLSLSRSLSLALSLSLPLPLYLSLLPCVPLYLWLSPLYYLCPFLLLHCFCLSSLSPLIDISLWLSPTDSCCFSSPLFLSPPLSFLSDSTSPSIHHSLHFHSILLFYTVSLFQFFTICYFLLPCYTSCLISLFPFLSTLLLSIPVSPCFSAMLHLFLSFLVPLFVSPTMFQSPCLSLTWADFLSIPISEISLFLSLTFFFFL